MHRQSLGSPASKLHSHGAKEDNHLLTVQDQKRKVQVPSVLITADHEESKSPKLHNSPSRPERVVHFIPIITVLCCLILYISSHDPSQKDLAQFNGFKPSTKPIDSTAIDDLGRFSEMEKGNVVAIRSLQVSNMNMNGPRYRPHRKIGDF